MALLQKSPTWLLTWDLDPLFLWEANEQVGVDDNVLFLEKEYKKETT